MKKFIVCIMAIFLLLVSAQGVLAKNSIELSTELLNSENGLKMSRDISNTQKFTLKTNFENDKFVFKTKTIFDGNFIEAKVSGEFRVFNTSNLSVWITLKDNLSLYNRDYIKNKLQLGGYVDWAINESLSLKAGVTLPVYKIKLSDYKEPKHDVNWFSVFAGVKYTVGNTVISPEVSYDLVKLNKHIIGLNIGVSTKITNNLTLKANDKLTLKLNKSEIDLTNIIKVEAKYDILSNLTLKGANDFTFIFYINSLDSYHRYYTEKFDLNLKYEISQKLALRLGYQLQYDYVEFSADEGENYTNVYNRMRNKLSLGVDYKFMPKWNAFFTTSFIFVNNFMTDRQKTNMQIGAGVEYKYSKDLSFVLEGNSKISLSSSRYLSTVIKLGMQHTF